MTPGRGTWRMSSVLHVDFPYAASSAGTRTNAPCRSSSAWNATHRHRDHGCALAQARRQTRGNPRRPGRSASIAESPATTNGSRHRTTHAAQTTACPACAVPSSHTAPTRRQFRRQRGRHADHLGMRRRITPLLARHARHAGQPVRTPHAKLRRRQHQEGPFEARRVDRYTSRCCAMSRC